MSNKKWFKKSEPPKELQIRTAISDHDMGTKRKLLMKWLDEGRPVLVRVKLKGREKADRAAEAFGRLFDGVKGYSVPPLADKGRDVVGQVHGRKTAGKGVDDPGAGKPPGA